MTHELDKAEAVAWLCSFPDHSYITRKPKTLERAIERGAKIEPLVNRDDVLEEASRIAESCSILDTRTMSIAATIRAAKGGGRHE